MIWRISPDDESPNGTGFRAIGLNYDILFLQRGVGRTMALANVGFLAAMAGKRVLLMDWDLEAPGLAYYFRGMTDHADSRRIRTADGILDLLDMDQRDPQRQK